MRRPAPSVPTRSLLSAAILLATPLLAFADTHAAARRASSVLQHVIIIMQENRSFDQYFGTFPGANGFPAGTCVPLNPAQPSLGCIAPFHDPHDLNAGGPHGTIDAVDDLDDGITHSAMDGFVYQQTQAALSGCKSTPSNCIASNEGVARHDVMGYHTAAEIPNYWTYAQHFVLQDNMFEGVRSWSLSSHVQLTSEWVARCGHDTVLSTCQTWSYPATPSPTMQYPWANLFQLMDVNNVSWKYYVANGGEPDCEDDEMTCEPQYQAQGSGSVWNPPPFFAWVKAKGPAYLAAHNPELAQFIQDCEQNTLPQVAWVVPSETFSEHPPSGITAGMEYVTSLVNAVMTSPAWSSSAIFIAWDDWGGFYDHVMPPNVDKNASPTVVQGFGLRVPGILISPYAKAGMIDHSVLSSDSYAHLVEDLFMNRARLDPAKLGQPDNRPDIRDALTQVTYLDGSTQPMGSLIHEFDFSQTPLPPLLLSTHIPTAISVECNPNGSHTCLGNSVKVSWRAVANNNVPGPFTYHVTRDGVDLPGCVTTLDACHDAPGSGVHLYRAYSVDSAGVTSPQSAAVEADVP